jgi:hypothetical protein
MAEVEFAPLAALPLVVRDDVGLHANRGRNHVGEQVVVTAQPREGRPLDPGEEIGIGDDGRLDRLGQPGPEVAVGERAQQRRIADDEFGLGEGPGHVLVSVDVHPVLAADARVDLPEQRRGDEPEPQAPHVSRRGEARHVGDDAAADGQHEGRPVDAQFDEPAVDPLHAPERLAPLARADEHRIVTLREGAPVPRDVRVDDRDHAARRQEARQQLAGRAYVNTALCEQIEGGFHASEVSVSG